MLLSTVLLCLAQEECIKSTVAKVPKLISTIKSEVQIKCSRHNRPWAAIYQQPRLKKETISATKVRQISTRMVLQAIRTWDQTLLTVMENLQGQISTRTGHTCCQERVKRKGRAQRRGDLQTINAPLLKEMNTDIKMAA